GFKNPPTSRQGDNLPKPALIDPFLGASHDRAVRPMVADQDSRARSFCLLHQGFGLLDSRRNGLLQQRRYARPDASQRMLDMQLARRRKNHAVGPALLEQFLGG